MKGEMMRRMIGLLIVLAACPAAYTDTFPPPYPAPMVLDEVNFQVTEKQWVTTQTALLMVNINVTLSDADLVKARTEIMGKLDKIASGDWHLTTFDRSQDSSGLEKLFVQAQARVKQESLTHIYQQAKAVTKPGASYEIANVEFKPSLDEVQQVKTALREKLYQKARDEMARLNQIYPGQTYTINQVMFDDGDAMPRPKSSRATEGLVSYAAAAPSLTVSNELVMTAMVRAASTRK
jgi:hypothetical protein